MCTFLAVGLTLFIVSEAFGGGYDKRTFKNQ